MGWLNLAQDIQEEFSDIRPEVGEGLRVIRPLNNDARVAYLQDYQKAYAKKVAADPERAAKRRAQRRASYHRRKQHGS